MGNAIVKFDDAFEVDLDLFEKFKKIEGVDIGLQSQIVRFHYS